MDTTLDTVHIVDLDDRLRHAWDSGALDRRVRITWAARLELRVGLWLLLNGSRRHAALVAHADRVANARALIDHEHRALRTHALTGIRT